MPSRQTHGNGIHTNHALAGADRFQRTLVLPTTLGGVIAIWCGWFVFARIERYEVSNSTRLEIDQGSFVVQSPTSGWVISTPLVLGQAVEAGDMLVQLDSNRQRLQLAEERARLAAINPERETHNKEAASLEQARLSEHEASGVAVKEALAHYHEVQVQARYVDDEAKRLKSLRANGLIPEREYAQGETEALRREAAPKLCKLPHRVSKASRRRETVIARRASTTSRLKSSPCKGRQQRSRQRSIVCGTTSSGRSSALQCVGGWQM